MIKHILIHLLADLLVVSGFALSARSGEPSQPYYASYVVRFGQARGSATGIGPNLLVTNQHVAGQATNSGTAIDATGNRHSIRCIATSQTWDLALCQTEGDELHWVKIAAEAPQPREDVWALGYGAGNNPKLASGVGVLRGVDGEGNYESTLVIQSGDSGSGMFNARGELVAVNRAVDGRYNGRGYMQGFATSVSLSKVRRFAVQSAEECPDCWRPLNRRPSRPDTQPDAADPGTRNPNGGENFLKPAQPPGPPVDLSRYVTKDELAAAEKRLQDAMESQRAALDKSLGVQGAALSKQSEQLAQTGKVAVQVKESTTKLTDKVTEVTRENSTLRDKLKQDFSAVHTRIDEAKAAGAGTAKEIAISVARTTIVERLQDLMPASPSGWAAFLGNLGFGGPFGLALGFGAWMITRRMKKEHESLLSVIVARRREGGAAKPFRPVSGIRRRIRERAA